jgi:hypothetical protein
VSFRRRRTRTWFLLTLGMVWATPIVRAQSRGEQPPVLTAFMINGGAVAVTASDEFITLAHTVVGRRPTEYRVSQRADFVGAVWLPYVEAPRLKDWLGTSRDACEAPHASRRVTLFFQVRATTGDELRVVDGQRTLVAASVESNVLRDNICAVPAPRDSVQ